MNVLVAAVGFDFVSFGPGGRVLAFSSVRILNE